MKSAIFCSIVMIASLAGMDAQAAPGCTGADGGGQLSTIPIRPAPRIATPANLPRLGPTNAAAPQFAPSTPPVRITVLPAEAADGSLEAEVASTPALTLTVVAEEPAVETPVVAAKDEGEGDLNAIAGQIDKLAGGAMSAIGQGSAKEESDLNSTLKKLIGTWLAVARHGDGELGTVELQLDKDGWARLTMPGADGQPESVKRKVEFKDNELKLIGDQSEVSLGKLIEFNERQLILARADDQVTFVRP